MAKKNQLPKTIFVRIEEDGSETYLIAGRSLEEASSGTLGSEKCGKYQLVESGVLLTEIRFDSR
jgi:hypothetical protein